MKKSISILLVVVTVTLLTFSQCKKDNCIEKPKEDCFCLDILSPVCGCNGKTYDNASVAYCYGIEVVKDGPCD